MMMRTSSRSLAERSELSGATSSSVGGEAAVGAGLAVQIADNLGIVPRHSPMAHFF